MESIVGILSQRETLCSPLPLKGASAVPQNSNIRFRLDLSISGQDIDTCKCLKADASASAFILLIIAFIAAGRQDLTFPFLSPHFFSPVNRSHSRSKKKKKKIEWVKTQPNSGLLMLVCPDPCYNGQQPEAVVHITFLKLAKERYSVRSFKDQPIENEKLNLILEASHIAPTACNTQPQKIYIAKSDDVRKKLAFVCRCTPSTGRLQTST